MTQKEKLINQMSCMTDKELAKAITTCCPSAFGKAKFKCCTRLGCEECWEKFLKEKTTDPNLTLYQTITELRRFKNKDQVIFDKEVVNSILKYLEQAYVILNKKE